MMERNNPKKLSIKSNPPAIIEDKEQEIEHLKKVIHHKNAEIDVLKYQTASINHKTINVSKPTFFIFLLLIISLLSLLVYSFINKKTENYVYTATIQDSLLSPDTTLSEDKINEIIYKEDIYKDPLSNKKKIENREIEDPEPIIKREIEKDATPKNEELDKNNKNIKAEKKLDLSKKSNAKKPVIRVIEEDVEYDSAYFDEPVRYEKYTINPPKAYLYNSPEVSAKGNYFMVPSQSTELSAIEEDNGFIYVTFLNTDGKFSKGWLRKVDLKQLY